MRWTKINVKYYLNKQIEFLFGMTFLIEYSILKSENFAYKIIWCKYIDMSNALVFTNNPSAGGSQFVLRRYGRSYNSSNIYLPNVRMTFIKSNNHYSNKNSARGMVGASSQAGNLNAIKRRT